MYIICFHFNCSNCCVFVNNDVVYYIINYIQELVRSNFIKSDW